SDVCSSDLQRQRGRDLGAVDQRQPFLGGQPDRLDPDPRQSGARGHRFAVEYGLALADHDRRHVRQRREIAGGTDRALFGNDRNDAPLQHGLDERHGFGPHAGGAATHRNELQCHHQPHDFRRKGGGGGAAKRGDQGSVPGPGGGGPRAAGGGPPGGGGDGKGRAARRDLRNARRGGGDTRTEIVVQ